MMSMPALLFLFVLALVVSAFTSLIETSFLSLSRIQLTRLAKVHPGRLTFWSDDPDRALAAILLVNNLVNVGIGFLMTALALRADAAWGIPLRWGGVLFPSVGATAVIIFGEIVPKVAARLHAEPIALALAPLLRAATVALSPLVRGLVDGTQSLVEKMSSRVKAEGTWDRHMIRDMLRTSPLSRSARSVAEGLLDFDRRTLEEIMIPRGEIFSVDLSRPKAEVIRATMMSEYSRVPVHRGSLDRTVGVLYAKDLLAAARESDLIVLDDLIRPLPIVTAETPLPGILRRFREGRLHMALVVDRQNRVTGLVTLQMLLEAIVGPVADEPELKD
jgi:CBS domain containing-hemolysin-like protein